MKLGSFNLRNLRQRDIALVAIVVTVLVALGWYFYLYRPTQDAIAELERENQNLELQIQRGEAAQRNLPTLRNEVAELEQERLDFLSQLPRESDVSSLLDQVRLSASDAEVLLQGIRQNDINEDITDVRPIGFTLSTAGANGDTMNFLNALESMRRFTKIRQVGLSVVDEGSADDPELNGDFELTVYVFTGEDPGEQ